MIKVWVLIVFLLQIGPKVMWVSYLQEQFTEIQKEMPCSLGVYVKNLGDNHSLNFNAKSKWYLSSTVKVPLAIAILQKVESGELSMDQRVMLEESDWVDGAGDLIRQPPGTTYTVKTLLEKMIRNSDSSAADMLFKLIGEEELNELIRREMVGEGFNRITSILQVRYEAYGELHENAANLTNIDFIEVKKLPSLSARLDLLMQKMNVDRSELKAPSVFDAFDRYYQREVNSATLQAMGLLLERLYKGELLSEEHTSFLLNLMQNITTGNRRIKAGLAEGTRFAQKTGTQIRSACNVGLIFPKEGPPIVVAACAQGCDAVAAAEQALQEVGKALNVVIENQLWMTGNGNE